MFFLPNAQNLLSVTEVICRQSLTSVAAFLNTNNISVTKLFESLVNFGKNKSQKNVVARSNQTHKTITCAICNQRYK